MKDAKVCIKGAKFPASMRVFCTKKGNRAWLALSTWVGAERSDCWVEFWHRRCITVFCFVNILLIRFCYWKVLFKSSRCILLCKIYYLLLQRHRLILGCVCMMLQYWIKYVWGRSKPLLEVYTCLVLLEFQHRSFPIYGHSLVANGHMFGFFFVRPRFK